MAASKNAVDGGPWTERATYVRYTDETKAAAVSAVAAGRSKVDVAREAGCSAKALGRWVKAADQHI